MTAIKKIMLIDSHTDTIQRQKYPVVYYVGKDNIVKLLETDSENDYCFDDDPVLLDQKTDL